MSLTEAPASTAPHLVHRSPSARQVSLAPAPTRPPSGPARRNPPALGIDALVDIATGLAQATELWRPHVHHDQLSRTSVRLLATEAYEVWLLGWSQGQGVDLHDHGGANAAFVVLDGELEELTLGPGGLRSRALRPGGVGTVAAGAVHDVINAGTVDATSIHVYSDPLTSMTFYDADGTPRHTELVQEVPALLASAGAGRALHPAAGRP